MKVLSIHAVLEHMTIAIGGISDMKTAKAGFQAFDSLVDAIKNYEFAKLHGQPEILVNIFYGELPDPDWLVEESECKPFDGDVDALLAPHINLINMFKRGVENDLTPAETVMAIYDSRPFPMDDETRAAAEKFREKTKRQPTDPKTLS